MHKSLHESRLSVALVITNAGWTLTQADFLNENFFWPLLLMVDQTSPCTSQVAESSGECRTKAQHTTMSKLLSALPSYPPKAN